MSIRNKILLNFSVAVILLSGAAFLFVYLLFSEYREEEFQQRQKDKIVTTLKFLTEIREIDEELLQTMDIATIHHLYDERLLIFNKDKRLIYSSVDDTPIPFSPDILESLNPDEPWFEKKDGLYDVVGVYVEHKGKVFLGISKAYDFFGYKKLRYLRYILWLTFFGITGIIGVVSYFLARKITHSIEDVTRQINNFDFKNSTAPVIVHKENDEISLLAQRFNELMAKLSEAFSFQRHAIHHISHELKTPIAILVSDFERMERETDKDRLLELIKYQKEGTKNLSEIINSLLEIAKVESGNDLKRDLTRIDEIIFDLADELNRIYVDFQFSIEYAQATEDDNLLILQVNTRLLRVALANMMLNCIRYSENNSAKVIIAPCRSHLDVSFITNGTIIAEEEKQFLFRHFFRGKNSKNKPGFGLGLVLIDRIIRLHHGTITYTNNGSNVNIFTITLPLN